MITYRKSLIEFAVQSSSLRRQRRRLSETKPHMHVATLSTWLTVSILVRSAVQGPVCSVLVLRDAEDCTTTVCTCRLAEGHRRRYTEIDISAAGSVWRVQPIGVVQWHVQLEVLRRTVPVHSCSCPREAKSASMKAAKVLPADCCCYCCCATVRREDEEKSNSSCARGRRHFISPAV